MTFFISSHQHYYLLSGRIIWHTPKINLLYWNLCPMLPSHLASLHTNVLDPPSWTTSTSPHRAPLLLFLILQGYPCLTEVVPISTIFTHRNVFACVSLLDAPTQRSGKWKARDGKDHAFQLALEAGASYAARKSKEKKNTGWTNTTATIAQGAKPRRWMLTEAKASAVLPCTYMIDVKSLSLTYRKFNEKLENSLS